MLNEKPRRRVRCPRCGSLRAALAGRWCDDCERQGDLPFVGNLIAQPVPPVEAPSPTSKMISEAFRRPAGCRDGLETATSDTNVDGTPNTEGMAYGALLRVEGDVVWRCNHLHRTAEGAFACASRERDRRPER
jgi:hypothetical protein